MILANLPEFARIIILVIAGACVGSFINWAIYSWTYFLKRSISPWMKRDERASPRVVTDRIPIVGWVGLRRDSEVHGRGFWIRPFAIEIVWAIGLPWFYFWQIHGGLVGELRPIPVQWSVWSEVWFIVHAVLIALMFIATFIDFDERTIPDWVTIPGTLFALVMAAVFSDMHLPEVVNGMAGNIVQTIDYGSSANLPTWHLGWVGLTIALSIFTIWIWALLPKITTMRYGIFQGIKIMLASVVRPRRKTNCELRTYRRAPFAITGLLGLLWLVGLAAIGAAQLMLPPANWLSLFNSIYGMAYGGGLVWGIRIVAGWAMQREAMGFGDVTLMAMIGAFLGWQASLLTFGFAPFAGFLIFVTVFILTRDKELAFGPYLCLACLILLLGWRMIWPWAELRYFRLGPERLLIITAGMIVMMWAMLAALQWMKGGAYEEET